MMDCGALFNVKMSAAKQKLLIFEVETYEHIPKTVGLTCFIITLFPLF